MLRFLLVFFMLAAPAAEARPLRYIRNACDRLLFHFAAKGYARRAIADPEVSLQFAQRAMSYLKSADDGNEIFRRQTQLIKMRPIWSGIFEELVRRRELLLGKVDHDDSGNRIFLIDRSRLIAADPKLKRILPTDTEIALSPNMNLEFAAAGWFDPENNRLGMPIEILAGPLGFVGLQTLTHESTHAQLSKLRHENGDRRFAYVFETHDEAFELVTAFINNQYAFAYSPEEIFAHLVNALNAFDHGYVGESDDTLEDPENLFNLTVDFVEVYFHHLLPAVLLAIDDGEFVEVEDVLVFKSADGKYEVNLASESKIGLRSQSELKDRLRADLLLELQLLESLPRRLEDLVHDPQRSTKLLWKFLERLGLDLRLLKIPRRNVATPGTDLAHSSVNKN